MIKVTITTYAPDGEVMYDNYPFMLKVDTVEDAIANKLRFGAVVTGPNQTTSIDRAGFMTVCDYEQVKENGR